MHPIKLPPPLSVNDEIRIVAPASIVERDYIEDAIRALKNLGYKVTLGKNVFNGANQFSGTDGERLADFQEALDDRNVRAIFCARGGYGSIRIADQLNFSGFRKKPKWIVGFSDITVFHSLLNCYHHIASIHSPMPVNFHSPHFSDNLSQLNNILKGKADQITILSDPLNRQGFAKGQLIGGNLSILHNLQSTPFEVKTKGAILFLEDIGEQLYHLDRMMQNLKLSGKLSRLRGLIVGGMTDMSDKQRPFGKTPNEIVLDTVKNFNFPVAFNFPAGHMANNIPFIIGGEIKLEVTGSGTLISTLK
jgi:muramoyltetrapeptide carboxypeptidase